MAKFDRGVGLGLAAVLALASGCTVDSKDEGFGDLGGTPMSGPGPGSSASSSASDSGDSGDSGSDGDDGPDDGDTAADSGDSGDDPSDSGGGSETGAGETGPGVDPQPDDGMYSDCETAAMCVGMTTCVVAAAMDGFCSNSGCADPLTDCDPTPGGDAPPICITYTSPTAVMVCALDCSAGQTCPGGMTCQDVQGSMVCA